MKYRIKQEQDGRFRAQILKERGSRKDWIAIENDNTSLVHCNHTFDTIDDAVEACKKHNINKGYNLNDNIVKEFEL